jgi:beta-lactamase regulating signal transducer with metallopeptidase domain/outer membrane lipoprotein-sorting protein
MEALHPIFQAEIIQKLGWALIHCVWQAGIIALLLAILLRLLRKSSANLRYITACAALAMTVLLSVITVRMVEVSVSYPAEAIEPAPAPVDLPRGEPEEIATATIPISEEIKSVESVVQPQKPSLRESAISLFEPALPYVVIGWLVGVFGLSLWHLGGWAQLQRLRRQMVKQVAPTFKAKLRQLSNMLGIQKTIDLVESALVQVPTVVGHLKPVILLPASALTGLSPEQIEAVLAHELAHIRRCDYLVNMLQTVVEILGFYHPAVWWVSHKIRIERENCCDDLAVSLCSDRICYARALTTMEEIRGSQLALAVTGSGGSLFERIRRLFGKDFAKEGKLNWLPSAIAMGLIGSLLIPVCFALSSGSLGEIERKNDLKTVTLAVLDEGSLDKVDSAMISMFDFSSEEIIGINVDLKGLTEREKGNRFYNTIFAAKADLLIKDDGEIVVLGPSTAEFKRMSLEEIGKIGFEDLAAHIRAEERRRPKEFIELPFFNQWLSPGEKGAFLTEDGVVVAVEVGEFREGAKKGKFKYIIVGQVDPQNLPEPKLITKLAIRNKLIGVLEYPKFITNSAKGLFEKIQKADYDYFLNSKDTQTWKEFPIVESYKTYKQYPQLVNWICNTFKDNPIVSVELGEVNASEKDWPSIEYKLILKDGSTIEGTLRFEYHFFGDNDGRWYGIHGIDWHLQEDPIKTSGSMMSLISEIEVVFNQPMIPDLGKVVDTTKNKERPRSTFARVYAFYNNITYDSEQHKFTIPLILPPDWEVSIELREFRTTNGIKMDPFVLNYSTGREIYSTEFQKRFQDAKKSKELRDILNKVKEARSHITSLSETVHTVHKMESWDESSKSVFKFQGEGQFYADISEQMNIPFYVGSDGRDCWYYNGREGKEKLITAPFDEVVEKNIIICDPFRVTQIGVSETIERSNIEYLGTDIFNSLKHYLLRLWSEKIYEDYIWCVTHVAWIDAETYMISQIISDHGSSIMSHRFNYEQINQSIADSEFSPEYATDIERSTPRELDEGHDTRFLNVIDGSNGRMSVRWGERGSGGTISSGLN